MSTIQDVAAAAKVSTTTVSRYLNKRIDLPSETAGRIDAAIRQLDYRPNILAKRLSLGKSEAIGLVTPEIANPFFAELAAAVEDEAEKHGYAVFMSSTGGHREREIATLRRLEDGHVDGLIMMTNQPDDGTLAASLHQYGHVVLIDEDIPGVNVPKIFVENRQGAHLATRHLIDAGHRHIAHIGGPARLFSATERLEGFLDALSQAGIEAAPHHLRQGAYARAFGLEAMREMLAAKDPPTAVFAGSDFIAIGVMQAVKERGLAVPRDISLVGFDDMPFAEFLAPGLTTVRQPTSELGRAGVRTLLALFDKKTPAALMRLPVTLVDRQSVAAPGRRRNQNSTQAKGN
jgi:LacI family transcriptional regulator